MTDITHDSTLQTGTIMTELVAKAREARGSGHSRRDFFASTAKLAGATALGAAGIGFIHPIAAQAASISKPSSDTPQQILDIAATAETLAVTFYNSALESSMLPNVNSAANRSYFQAAVIQEAEHLLFLEKLGGKSLASQFYFPNNMFTDETVFFPTASLLEDFFISAYIAAAMDFSGAYSSGITKASPLLIGAAVQIAGVESEHRALLNVAANISPPNNRIIESALVPNVNAAVPPLTPFLQGGQGFSSTPVPFPTLHTVEQNAKPYGFGTFPKHKFV